MLYRMRHKTRPKTFSIRTKLTFSSKKNTDKFFKKKHIQRYKTKRWLNFSTLKDAYNV
jgi:hypothetical protein